MEDILIFAAIGFVAQLVDGAIGMAYGLSATSILLGMGVPPPVASASVHAAEVFTTGASGFSHWRLGNVDMALLKRLAIPGALGGALGAYVLATVSSEALRPFVSLYLMGMGGLIFFKALNFRHQDHHIPKRVGVLGFVGGFLDASGGGGWGPMVTTTLVGRGTTPRVAIGSTNLAEFFVTVTVSLVFLSTIGLELWPIITGLVIGGVCAAPLAAYVAHHVPPRSMMFIVAIAIVLLSGRNLAIALHLV